MTNAQYRRFVDAGGYAEDKPWWTEEAVKELAWDKNWRKGPRLWGDPRFDRDIQPVVGVSWYEAVAYCEWLTAQMHAEGEIRHNEEVRLPTEAEWMRAAHSTHGGEYPWNGDFNLAFANTNESSLGQATPVHMYRCGKTTEEIWDLVGNVWEWLQTPEARLKGGSWSHGANSAVASAWGNGEPDDWDIDDGFRVVVVHASHAPSEMRRGSHTAAPRLP